MHEAQWRDFRKLLYHWDFSQYKSETPSQHLTARRTGASKSPRFCSRHGKKRRPDCRKKEDADHERTKPVCRVSTRRARSSREPRPRRAGGSPTGRRQQMVREGVGGFVSRHNTHWVRGSPLLPWTASSRNLVKSQTPGPHTKSWMQQIGSGTKEAVSFTRAPMTDYSS